MVRQVGTVLSHAASLRGFPSHVVRDGHTRGAAHDPGPDADLYKTGSRNWSSEEHGAYLAERVPGAKLVGVAGSSPVLWLEEPTPIVSAIERFLASVGEEEADLNRVLATVLFTDIVGSTERAAQLGDRGWKQLVERHHQTVRVARPVPRERDRHGRRRVLRLVRRPARAVRCAQAIV